MRKLFGRLALVVLMTPFIASATTCPSITTNLQLDSSGQDVTVLQQYLSQLGYLSNPPVPGYFDITTQQALEQYQADVGIVSSGSPATTGWGVVGSATQAALARCVQKTAPTPKSTPKTRPTTPPASTSASPDTASQIAALLAQLAQLQKLMVTLQQAQPTQQGSVVPTSETSPANTTPTPSPAATGAVNPSQPTSATRTLSRGMSGSDVTALQQFLVTQYSNFTSDYVTGYFGPTTQAAVEQWQRDHNIVSSGSPDTTGYGAVGPKTSAAIASAGTASSASAPASSSPAPESQSVSESQCSPFPQPTAACATSWTPVSDANGCTTLWRCVVQTTAPAQVLASSCPVLATPACTGGTLQWQGRDSNGCSLGYQCTTQTTQTQTPTVPVTPAPASCTWNNQSVANGASVTAYQSGSVAYGQTCAQQTRTCENGTLSGSYAAASCAAGAAASCSWNNQSVANGATVTAYQTAAVPYGTQCTSEQRTCQNGTLSGSLGNASCTVTPAASCTLSGVTVANGGSKVFYSDAGIAYGDSCTNYAQTRTCTNGTLSGSASYQFGSCIVGQPNACTFNGATVSDSSSITAYQASTVPFGQTCAQQTRTCTNGTLSGTYQSSACTVTPATSCTFNGSTVAHGASVTAYQSSTVPYGSTCTPQTRTCSNGSLSGSYTNAACTVQSAASCTFNGQSVADGASVTAYQTSSVPSGQQCVSQQRACSNGTLSGSYTNGTCSVQQQVNAYAPTGFFDSLDASGNTAGWAVDKDVPSQSINVAIYMDGDKASGKLIATVPANSPRSDVDSALGVSGNHGFVWQIPSQYLTSTHTWYVYGVDSSDPTSMTLLTNSPKTYAPAPPPGTPAGNCTSKCIGMEYELIFPTDQDGWTYWGPPSPNGEHPNEYVNPLGTWSTPLLGDYNSTDPNIIDKHAEWMTDLGVNFILDDWTNSSQNDVAGNPSPDRILRTNTDALFAEYEKLSQQGKQYPRVTIVLGAQDEGNVTQSQVLNGNPSAVQEEADYIYTNYVQKYPDIYFSIGGKPLLVVYTGIPQQPGSSINPGWSDPRFTVRIMSVYNQAPQGSDIWSWADRGSSPAPAYLNGSVEAVTVSQAYPGCYGWDVRSCPGVPAVAGRDGTTNAVSATSNYSVTFQQQWSAAVGYNPQIIILNQWNEWIHTDQYTTNFSNDLEPSVALGCGPMTAVQQAVEAWKGVTLPAINCTANLSSVTAPGGNASELANVLTAFQSALQQFLKLLGH